VLEADVFRPADKVTGRPAVGPFPVIVTLTPYRKFAATFTTGGEGYNPYFVQRGFIYAVVDVRGTGASEGTFCFFCEREQQDGPEVIRWAARLPGSDGAVGMYGGSYLGITQLLTAARMGPGSPLKAIVPLVAANDVYRDFAAPGGLLADAFSAGWFDLVRPLLDTLPPDDVATNPLRALRAVMGHAGNVPSTSLPLTLQGLLGGGAAYDGPLYQQRDPGNGLAAIVRNGIPTMLVGGWSDVFQRGEPLNYAGLQNAAAGRPVDLPMDPTQKADGRYQLVMGPWFHLAAVGVETLPEIALRWFDRWLKGQDTGIDRTTTPLHAFEVGSKRWVDTSAYPFKGVHIDRLFMQGGGGLSADAPGAALANDSIAWVPLGSFCNRQAEQWSAGPSSFAAYLKVGDKSPNPCTEDDRAMQIGALTYTTAPFRTRTSVAGPMTASLYLTSSRPDAEVAVTVEDVAPNGASYPLTAGYLLGSFRRLDTARSWFVDGKLVEPFHLFTRAGASPLQTGRVERLDVEVFPVLASLAPGDRLRVTITTSATPYLAPTLGEGVALAGGVYQIERTGQFPSHVDVPLIDSDRLLTSPTDWGRCNASC